MEAASAGMPDADRPLTPEGERKFEQAARGLAAICDPPDVILTSPLRRAVETAVIACGAWSGQGRKLRVEEEPLLAGGDPDDLCRALAERPSDSTALLVGHEPHIAWFLAWLIGGQDGGSFRFRKGGASLVESSPVGAGTGRLVWYLPPRLLRHIGGK